MAKQKLTKKQRGFVKDYIATESATEAAARNYKVKDRIVAKAVGSENLTKPYIQDAIREALGDDYLAEKHQQLFDQKKIDYFVFAKSMSDEEIIDHVASVGIKVITIRESDKGKLAFYSIADTQAMKGALEMAYKIKGSFAPEKTVNLNIEVEADDEVKKLADQINALHRGTSITGDGVASSVVGKKIQD